MGSDLMARAKVYMEIVLDVDGNLAEASKRLCEQMSKLNYSSVCVNKNESYSYNVIEAKFSNGWIKEQKDMKLNRNDLNAWK